MAPSNGTRDAVPHELQNIPLAYSLAESDASARALIYALNPEWKTSEGDLEFVRFKEGITNTLFKAIKKRPGHTERQIDEEAVLLRAYGAGSAVLIDREREALSHALLARYGLAPALLARFENGLLYRYIEGVACTPEDLRSQDIWTATARRLGQWHGILPTSEVVADGSPTKKYENITQHLAGKPQPSIWTIMQKWIDALPSKTQEEKKRNALLQSELEASTKRFGNVDGLDHGEYILGHCDLLCGNVIITPKTGNGVEVDFIDYEYATPAPAAFDLANHFAEWGGFDCDFNVLPTRYERRDFIQSYVRSYRQYKKPPQTDDRAQSSKPIEEEVEHLIGEVDAFRGIPGLYWGIWALIQAEISQIDFDYASYADIRLGEYKDWKAEDDGSRAAEGRDMPLRERRLAQEK